MPGKTDLYSWDSCLILAWLNDEDRPPGEMEGVREYLRLVERGEIRLIVSALLFTEVRRAKVSSDNMEALQRVMRRRNVSVVAANRRIAMLAGELRSFYEERSDEYNHKTLSTPDSIHLATAIIYEAKAFHTFDRKNSSGTLGLLPLSGNVAGYPLCIEKPKPGPQGSLDFSGSAKKAKG